MERPTESETIMKIARAIAERSTCSRLQVGAVIVDERGVILSSGRNGALSGMPHCDHTERPDEPCRLAMHAEANAIVWAARRGVAVEGHAIYVTHEPCYECAKLIIQSGISAVYFHAFYGRNSGARLLLSAGLDVRGDVA